MDQFKCFDKNWKKTGTNNFEVSLRLICRFIKVTLIKVPQDVDVLAVLCLVSKQKPRVSGVLSQDENKEFEIPGEGRRRPAETSSSSNAGFRWFCRYRTFEKFGSIFIWSSLDVIKKLFRILGSSFSMTGRPRRTRTANVRLAL